MGNKVKTIIGVIFLLLLDLYMIVSGIIELAAKDKQYDRTICAAYDILDVEHSINGLIPLGHEYYYVALDESEEYIYILRAQKKWPEGKFGDDGYVPSGNVVQIHGESKKMDYDISNEIHDRISSIPFENYALGSDQYLDLTYKSIAVRKILGAVLLLAGAVLAFIIAKIKDTAVPSVVVVTRVIAFAAFMIGCILVIISLR